MKPTNLYFYVVPKIYRKQLITITHSCISANAYNSITVSVLYSLLVLLLIVSLSVAQTSESSCFFAVANSPGTSRPPPLMLGPLLFCVRNFLCYLTVTMSNSTKHRSACANKNMYCSPRTTTVFQNENGREDISAVSHGGLLCRSPFLKKKPIRFQFVAFFGFHILLCYRIDVQYPIWESCANPSILAHHRIG